MGRSAIITSKGMNLLHSSSGRGDVSYWIGYYGLAYVPGENRAIGAQDELKADMTCLTKTGDHIYNIWQGSMPRDGYTQADSDGSAAGTLYGLAQYTSNITSRYRYVLDENNNNNLVMWRGTADSSNSEVQLAHVYQGVGSGADTECLPIPAPLFYMGEPTAYKTPMTKGDFVNAVKAPGIAADFPTKGDLPAVTTDPRSYTQSASTMSNTAMESKAAFTKTTFEAGKYEWCSSKSTYSQNGEGDEGTEIQNEGNLFCQEFWKFQSISNYNRFHAPATAEGYSVDYEPACRNMAKVTKLFPINYYKVLNVTGNMESPTGTELASSMQYTVKVSVADIFNTTAKRAVSVKKLDPDQKVTHINSINGKDMEDETACSFKFNRLGLYAVPMTVHRFYGNDNTGEKKNQCFDYKVQFEIVADAEPVLFAVVDLDQTVSLQEGGSAETWEFNINLNIAEAEDDGDIIRDAGIFYNMYEDDAITWYKNQLIANASTSEAITDLGIEMNYLKSMIGDIGGGGSGCDGSIDLSDLYALKNHTHDYMRNIVDSDKIDNYAVRGIDTVVEGSDLLVNTYEYVPAESGQTGYGYVKNDAKDNTRTYFVVGKSTN